LKFTASTSRPAPGPHPLRASGAIEWEELPSFAESLSQRLGAPGDRRGMTWDATMPMPLEARPEPEPFREALHGLATRELREPDVFRHFFPTLR